jgi:hypothetical protein
MTRAEHLLKILEEECCETAQRVSKAMRFGLTEVQPGQGLSNSVRILLEYYDAVAMVEMLQAEGFLPAPSAKQVEELKSGKKSKVDKFLTYSEKCGTLTSDAGAARALGVLRGIVNRYENAQRATGRKNPFADSERWAVARAMYVDAKDAVK